MTTAAIKPWASAAALVALAATVPYLPVLHDYFIQDDFGVVALLSQKPASAFPGWFVSTWMDDIWGYTPDEIRPFPAVQSLTNSYGVWWTRLGIRHETGREPEMILR